MTTPRFVPLPAPRAESVAARIYAFMREEQGRWTASGIADEIGLAAHKASRALQHLKERGLVRVVGTIKRPAGIPPAIYELIE
jgi:predicted ArsR family transcriptional regulator